MIERLFLQDYLSFPKVELEFQKGLIVFTGPSGAGKSILIDALLALFGLKTVQAKVSEVVCDFDIDLEAFGLIKEEPIVVRALKKEKVRYFLGSQVLSKALLKKIFSQKVFYLHQKEQKFFESENLLKMIEAFIEEEEFFKIKKRYQELFFSFQKLQKELDELLQKEKDLITQREFLEFEIQKIASIDPKIGEYEELMELKKRLSKKEKIAEAIQRAQAIFEYEGVVTQALELIEHPSDFFDEAMNELKDIFYTKLAQLEELEEVDAQEILERLEQLSDLKRRYGSIEEALQTLKQKREELELLENIEYNQRHLEEKVAALKEELTTLARQISDYRQKGAVAFAEAINAFLSALKLPKATFTFASKELSILGADEVVLELAGVNFKKISSGEYNRLRLAVMAAWSQKESKEGVLIVDEIDANISGEESMAVAKILKLLSRHYQIFAISHQAQLASIADQHFLVTKDKESRVKEICDQEREQEIARIISGEEITKEALEYAKRALKEAS